MEDRTILEQIDECDSCRDRKASVAAGESYLCNRHYELLHGQERFTPPYVDIWYIDSGDGAGPVRLPQAIRCF